MRSNYGPKYYLKKMGCFRKEGNVDISESEGFKKFCYYMKLKVFKFSKRNDS